MVSLETNNDFLNQGSASKKKRTPQEIEMDNFPEYYALNTIDAYNSLKEKKGATVAKERLILSQRIENLSFRYKNFIMPIKHKKEDK